MKLEEYPHEDKMEGTGVQFCKRGLIKTYNKLFLAAIFFFIARVKFARACAIKTTLLILFSNSRKLLFFLIEATFFLCIFEMFDLNF